jgi:hypothetical protein
VGCIYAEVDKREGEKGEASYKFIASLDTRTKTLYEGDK